VCLWATTMVEAPDQSGLITCNVLATSGHWLNVDHMAGEVITVATEKMCQLSVLLATMVSVRMMFASHTVTLTQSIKQVVSFVDETAL